MITFVIVIAIFLFLSYLFGEKIAKFLLNLTASVAVGGVVWFIYGIDTGHGSVKVFLISSLIVFLCLSVISKE